MLEFSLTHRPLEQRHPHDCEACVYLGTWRQREDEGPVEFADLYVCPNGTGTVIAREGPDGDYRSGMTFAQTGSPLAAAAFIALRRGLFTDGLMGQIEVPGGSISWDDRDKLERAGIPAPGGLTVERLRFIMRSGDWWAQTKEDGWLWWDARGRLWKRSLHGPD